MLIGARNLMLCPILILVARCSGPGNDECAHDIPVARGGSGDGGGNDDANADGAEDSGSADELDEVFLAWA